MVRVRRAVQRTGLPKYILMSCNIIRGRGEIFWHMVWLYIFIGSFIYQGFFECLKSISSTVTILGVAANKDFHLKNAILPQQRGG